MRFDDERVGTGDSKNKNNRSNNKKNSIEFHERPQATGPVSQKLCSKAGFWRERALFRHKGSIVYNK